MQNKKKVLCVDDEPINLLILRKILGRKYEVITAKHGEEALLVLEKDPEIELVITDMNMPGMNGLEFVREASKQFLNKKFFMLSGYAITDEIQGALDTGLIYEYFQKPTDYKQIDQALEEHSFGN
ncbi:MAG: response regulator [Phaeodactylibacter sp.]|uniref:response regulator n=1 Tax=Phaeodactylibacter sp. TaxID=1940289 RepID=UPI0032EB01A3